MRIQNVGSSTVVLHNMQYDEKGNVRDLELAAGAYATVYDELAELCATLAAQMAANNIVKVSSAEPSDGTGVAILKVQYLDSNVSAGGAASEALDVPGLLATDTVLAVSQKTAGDNAVALVSFSAPSADALTVGWTADPGANAVVRVCIAR